MTTYTYNKNRVRDDYRHGIIGLVALLTLGLLLVWLSKVDNPPAWAYILMLGPSALALFFIGLIYTSTRPIEINDSGIWVNNSGFKKNYVEWKDVIEVRNVRIFDKINNRYRVTHVVIGRHSRMTFTNGVDNTASLLNEVLGYAKLHNFLVEPIPS